MIKATAQSASITDLLRLERFPSWVAANEKRAGLIGKLEDLTGRLEEAVKSAKQASAGLTDREADTAAERLLAGEELHIVASQPTVERENPDELRRQIRIVERALRMHQTTLENEKRAANLQILKEILPRRKELAAQLATSLVAALEAAAELRLIDNEFGQRGFQRPGHVALDLLGSDKSFGGQVSEALRSLGQMDLLRDNEPALGRLHAVRERFESK